jgi:hypothetical protein
VTDEKTDSEKPSASTPEQQVAKKFLQGTAASLIQWMPLGSSAWFFLSFLKNSEVMQALIMLPLTGLAAAWAAYSKGFLARVQTVYEERGKKDFDSLMAWQEGVDKAVREAIRWQFAGTEDKYLSCQGTECELYKTEGLNTFKPILSEVFVPLELSGDFWRSREGHDLPMPPGFNWEREIAKLAANDADLRIWDILKRTKENPAFRSFVIQAWGGYGKTTLLCHMTYVYGNKLNGKPPYSSSKMLPVLLYLRQWQKVIAEEKPDLPTLIEKHHIPHLSAGKELKLPPNWAKHWLNRKAEMLVLFDGFDEVKDEWRESVSQWIGEQMRNYRDAVFILTSRPAAFRQDFVDEHKPNLAFFVKGFNENQRETFVRRWYLSRERHFSAKPDHPTVKTDAAQKAESLLRQLQERSELSDLARNPLMLTMIVTLHASYPAEELPQRRTDLYREIIRLQLGDRPLSKQINLLLSLRESQQVLQKLALFMVQENITRIPLDILRNQVQTYINELEFRVDADKFLQQIEQVSELLVKVDEEHEFAHRNFQSYLSACAIIEQKQEHLLLDNWDKTEWKETILMYAAQVNPSSLIRSLLSINNQQSVALAYQCLKNSSRKVEPELEKELQQLTENVQDLRYQNLENYLKNQQWREADEETYRLMITTVGKEEGQLFDREDMENFPCEDLRTIDQLWVKYSKGHFGFSVQKNIWLECGGVPGEYDYDIFRKFGDRVGWRKGGSWLSDKELTYVLKSTTPVAHLPVANIQSSCC